MKPLTAFELVGVSLTFVGSFLPWETSGGFLNYPINGIRIDFACFKYWITGICRFPVYDYGGTFVISLTLAIIFLAIRPPQFIKNPTSWVLIISTVLMASSLLFVGRWLIHLYDYDSTIEQPSLMGGLICVVFGSALLLCKTAATYLQAARLNAIHRQSQPAP